MKRSVLLQSPTTMFLVVLIAFTLTSVAGASSGIKWIKVTAGDPLPKNVTEFPHHAAYVGRARHFDNILPAEVWTNSSATVSMCGKTLMKHTFEVLTSAVPCTWRTLQMGENLPEDLLLVGHQNINSPIFVGSWGNSYYRGTDTFMHTFSLSANELDHISRNGITVLVCPRERIWIDTPAKDVPKNAVSAGKSRNGNEVFVARLQKHCQTYPGQVVPKDGIATTWVGEEVIDGQYCQVLTGDPDQYSWVSVTENEFPDNAVVGSTDGSHLYYIAKELTNDIVIYVTNLFLDDMRRYQILVENVKEVKIEPLSHGFDRDLYTDSGENMLGQLFERHSLQNRFQ